MLLGADGNPLRSDGNAPPAQKLPPPPAGTVDDGIASGAPIAPPDRTNTLGTFSMPDDLANFDPTFDPLAVERPAYDLAAASGRPDEAVYGACGPASAAELPEWVAYMKNQMGATRMLGLFTAEDAAARSQSNSPEGYYSEIIAAGGFDSNKVGLIDPRSPGAREAVMQVMRDTAQSRERLCVHCANGHSLTGVVLADWLLTDWIGGDNYEEACDTLRSRLRLAGVERVVYPDTLEYWMQQGHL